MKKRNLLLVFLVIIFFSPSVSAQILGVKTNLLYGGYTFTPNLGVEVGLGKHTTLEITGGYNPWNLDGANNNNKKLVHWLGQAEFRYFLCERFNGHFFGIHALGGMYNISAHELPMIFGKGSGEFRHQGWVAGVGVSYGYQLVLGRSWNLEFNVGVGYSYLSYEKYRCVNCGEKQGDFTRNYFGPTKVGISIIYNINKKNR